jgi:hypothetical protein
MTFNEQPTGTTGALSPLIYQAYDANYTQAGFYYQFEIYVWSGTTTLPITPIVTIDRKPDQFGGGRGWIDAHKIAAQYITTDFLVNGTYKPNIGDGAYYVAVKVQGIYDSGSTAQITSNTQLVTGGWNYTIDGLNADYSAKYVYTDKPAVYITANTTEYYLWYDATQITTIGISAYTTTPNTVSTSGTKIQGIDVMQLITAAGTTGEDYPIVFSYSGGSVSIPIEYQCPNKYGEVDIHFLNKYGVYDSFVFNALSRKTINITREQYNQPIYKQADLNTAWSYGVQITTPYHTNGIEQIVVNTDYLPQAYNEVMKQLQFSQNILMVEGSDVYSVRITDTAYTEKTIVNDKLIQYTFTLEYNQPVINKIVR